MVRPAAPESAETDSRVGGPAPRAISLLVDWSTARPRWIQELVSGVLEHRNRLPVETVRRIFAILEQEEIHGGGSVEASPSSLTADVSGIGDGALRLLELRDTHNVNALAEEQAIAFHPRLTVVFGENGSGKSGYTRILKRVAATRADEEILPDIGVSRSAGNDRPSALLRFLVGDAEQSVVWRNERGLAPLTLLDVFDSKSASQHVDPNLPYAYTPQELRYFPLAQEALDAVQGTLRDEVTQRSRVPVPILSPGYQGTRTQEALQALGPDTDLAAVETLAAVAAEEVADLEALRDEVRALETTSVETEISLCTSEQETLVRVKEALEAVSLFDFETYTVRLAAKTESERERARVAVDLAQPAGQSGELKPAWEAYACAAEEYLDASGRADDYPRESDICIYCQQPLSAGARTFLSRVREIAIHATDRAVAASSAALDAHRATLCVEDPVRLLNDARALGTGTRASSRVVADVLPALERAVTCLKAIADLGVVDEGELIGEMSVAVESVAEENRRLTTLLSKLRTEQSSRTERAQEARKTIKDIESRQELSGLLPGIRSYVDEQRWVRAAQAVMAGFPSHAKALTTAAKRASEALLNRRFTEHFKRECDALRAPKVQLTFPGRDGRVQREKRLGANIQPSRVLSEGEQKSLALADFLAEMALKTPVAPVVFDDPVNSLDSRRIGLVAGRLVALSEERQVIVFTHSIPFVAEILDRVEKPKGRFLYYEVECDGGQPGQVVRLESPRMDSPKALERTIRETITSAEAEKPGALKRMLVKKGYDHLRSLCEVVIEHEIFGNVVRRFRRNIMPTRLGQLPFAVLEEVCTEVEALFGRVCGVIDSHSQPDEVISIQHGVADLKSDFAALETIRVKLKSKVGATRDGALGA